MISPQIAPPSLPSSLCLVNGGMLVGPDGRIHTTLTHNPSSLRFSSVDPNLQNLPRPNAGEWAKWVKDIFIAPDGSLFWARDYSAIEAVLVGYFAGDPTYVRFAKLGVHAYLASHILDRPADLAWSDNDLKAYFKQLKKEAGPVYDTAKRIVHGSNYVMTPKRIHDLYTELFPTIKKAADLQRLYFDLFPSIPKWHHELCNRVDGARKRVRGGEELPGPIDPFTLGVCYVQNPFGYVHRFYNVLDWEKMGTEWVSSFGDDAKRLVSFLPQSTAAGIIKRATKRLWYDYPEVGQTLRLLIHDEIFGETPERLIDECLMISQQVMEEPVPELPLDPQWGMGEFLAIGTEAKVGRVWSEMA